MRNLRLAFRTLFKTPFVTAVAVLSLALGIGANAAIFSLFDQTLLQPLPVSEPGRLVNLGAPGPKPGSQSCSQAGDCDVVFSYPMFRDLERQQTVLSGLAAHREFGVNLSYREQPLSGRGTLVSGSYFPTLGIRPALGRLIGPSDDAAIGAGYVTVLSYNFWESRLGADPSVVGKTIVVNGHSLEIIGVAPRGFDGTVLGSRPMIFVPITMREALSNVQPVFENRRSYWIYLFGRLKPGVSLEQAKTGLNAVYRPIITEVEAPLQQGMSEQTLGRFKTKEVAVEYGAQGQSSVHKEAKTPLLMLFGVTAIVLLIACANIANLLLARGAGRATEMGVRLALGASRAQLLTQLLTESVLLALMGGVAGLLVARWTLSAIASLLPPDALTTLHFELQPSVILFSAVLAVATGILFGMFPALHSTRSDLVTAIRANAGQVQGARGAARFRATLVTVQIALATALLVSAGLFMKSLVNVTRVNLGVTIDHVVTFAISPEQS
ncbi:MAG: ABC transporter permease, partial [Gemmatimonadales bacterium]